MKRDLSVENQFSVYVGLDWGTEFHRRRLLRRLRLRGPRLSTWNIASALRFRGWRRRRRPVELQARPFTVYFWIKPAIAVTYWIEGTVQLSPQKLSRRSPSNGARHSFSHSIGRFSFIEGGA